MPKKLVIFDFDGVLVRTADIGYTLHTKHNPHLSREYFTNFSNGNFMENLEKAIAEDGYSFPEGWDDEYNAELLKLSSHEVINGLVRDLSREHTLVIVSSSHSRHIKDFVRQEGIEECFAEILGSDTHVSKVVKINRLLEEHSLPPEDVVFITDTLGDIREGNACNVKSIGVTWGTHDTETLQKGLPYRIVDTVPELEHAVTEFFEMQKLAQ